MNVGAKKVCYPTAQQGQSTVLNRCPYLWVVSSMGCSVGIGMPERGQTPPPPFFFGSERYGTERKLTRRAQGAPSTHILAWECPEWSWWGQKHPTLRAASENNHLANARKRGVLEAKVAVRCGGARHRDNRGQTS